MTDPDYYIICDECGFSISFGERCIPVWIVQGIDDPRHRGYMHLYHFTQNPE